MQLGFPPHLPNSVFDFSQLILKKGGIKEVLDNLTKGDFVLNKTLLGESQ